MDIFNTVTGFGATVMGFKENRFQVTKLKQEVRDVQLFLVYLKKLINTLIKSKINFCHLPTLIDSVNAFQIFLDKNILGYNTKIVDKAFIEKWPEWYRPELKTMINLIMYHIQILQQEYNGYHAIALEKLLGNDDEKKLLTEIRKQLRKKRIEMVNKAAEIDSDINKNSENESLF